MGRSLWCCKKPQSFRGFYELGGGALRHYKESVGLLAPRTSKGCEHRLRRTALETLDEAARTVGSGAAGFERLVEETGASLVRYAARLLGSVADGEDVVQESYVKAFDALAEGRFDGRSALKTWLYRIVTRTAIDHKRSRGRRERLADAALPPGFDGTGSADGHVALRELADALDVLPDEQREALVLQAMEGFSNREIGEILGCSEGAVEQRLVRARAALRERLSP